MPDEYGLLTEVEKEQIEKDVKEMSENINVVKYDPKNESNTEESIAMKSGGKRNEH